MFEKADGKMCVPKPELGNEIGLSAIPLNPPFIKGVRKPEIYGAGCLISYQLRR